MLLVLLACAPPTTSALQPVGNELLNTILIEELTKLPKEQLA